MQTTRSIRLWIVPLLLLLAAPAAFADSPGDSLMVVTGKETPIAEGDRHHRAVYGIEIPEGTPGPLHLRIYDADLGGRHDRPDPGSETRYLLFGKGGIDLTIRGIDDPLPTAAPLARLQLGADPAYDGRWRTVAPIDPADGEATNGRRAFMLVVDGVSGRGINQYGVFVSADPKSNRPVPGLRLGTPMVSVALPPTPRLATQLRLTIPPDADRLMVENFDADPAETAATIHFEAPFVDPVAIPPSPNARSRTAEVAIDPELRGGPGAIVFRNSGLPNYIQVEITDGNGRPVPIQIPVFQAPANHLPEPVLDVLPLSDCVSVVLDATGTTDPDGDPLTFTWDFADGASRTGGRIVHDFGEPGEHLVTLTVRDRSGFVADGRKLREVVRVNAAPTAKIEAPARAVPGEAVTIDGRGSSDPDGRISRYRWDLGDGTRSARPTVTHQFDRPGRYRVRLLVSDDGKSPCSEAEADHWIAVNAPPIPRLTAPASVAPGVPISLDASGSFDSDGRIISTDWDLGDGTAAGEPRVDHAYETPGTYTVRVRVTDDAGLANSSAETTATVIVNAPPVPDIDYPATVAAGETVAFDAAGSADPDGTITAYTWEMGDGTGLTGETVQHAYAAPGSYTVRLTVTDDTATANRSVSAEYPVRVNHPPVPDAGPDRVVNASRVDFDASGSTDPDDPIIGYHWDFGDGTEAEGMTVSHVYAIPGSYTVTLTVTDASETASARRSDTAGVRVNHPPTADAGGDRRVAPGESIDFDARFSGDPDGEIQAYRWGLGPEKTADGPRITHAFSDPGVYPVRLTVIDDDGAEGNDYAEITVNAAPTAWFPPVKRVAPGETVRFDGSASTDPDGEITGFRWEIGDPDNSGTPVTGRVVEQTFDTPGRYPVSLTVTDDSQVRNGSDTLARIVAVNHPPAPIGLDDIQTCRQTVRFDAGNPSDPDGDPIQITWDFGDLPDAPPHAGAAVTHVFPGPGLYPVTLTADDGQGLSNSVIQERLVVAINAPPVAAIAVDGRTHCAGQLVLFDAAGSKDLENGRLRYQWDLGDGELVEGINPVRTYRDGGDYRVRLTVTDDSGLPCDTGTAETLLHVIDAPIADAGPDRTVCAYAPVSFDGGESVGGGRRIKTYEWDFGDGASGVGVTPTHVYAEAGTYTARLVITVSGAGPCEAASEDEAEITVLGAPVATFETTLAACDGIPVVFDAGASTPPEGGRITEYRWDFGDGTEGSGETVEHSFPEPGAYPVSLTITSDSEECCNSTVFTELVRVNARPSAVIEVHRPGEPPESVARFEATVGTRVRFSGLSGSDPDGVIGDYRWDFGDGTEDSAAAPTHVFPAPGEYPVSLTVQDTSGSACDTDTETVRVVVRKKVPAAIRGPDQVCVGEPAEFSVPGADSADWRVSNGTTITGNPAAITFDEPGRYQVQASHSGEISPAVTVTALAIPKVVLPPGVDAFAGDEVTVRPRLDTPSDIPLTRTWETGDGHEATGETLRHQYETPGEYTLRLKITAPDGPACMTRTHEIPVRIHPPPEVEIRVMPESPHAGGARDAARLSAGTSEAAGSWRCRWDFGDGTGAIGWEVNHAWAKPGRYTVRVYLTDPPGRTDRTFTAERTVTVSPWTD